MAPEPNASMATGTLAKVHWNDGQVYDCKIIHINIDGTCKVRWLDASLHPTKYVTKRLSISRLLDITSTDDNYIDADISASFSIFDDDY